MRNCNNPLKHSILGVLTYLFKKSTIWENNIWMQWLTSKWTDFTIGNTAVYWRVTNKHRSESFGIIYRWVALRVFSCVAESGCLLWAVYFLAKLYNTLFQQHKRRLYTWTSLDGQHWNQIDYILCSQRWRRSIQSTKTRPGADCGSDHQLLIAKFRLKLNKVGKTTRQFRYDLSQIFYGYTVEMRKRFKGLDLIECLMNHGRRFVTLYRRQGSRLSPTKRNAKKQNNCPRKPYK